MATSRKQSRQAGAQSARRARASSSSAQQTPMPQHALALLKADHREVEDLFRQFRKAESKAQRARLAGDVCKALKIHMAIEEEIFYPAYASATNDLETNYQARVEHDGAKKLIAEIESAGPSDEMFDARVTVLAEMLKHHIKEEERFGGMFSRARWSKMDMNELGQQLAQRKQELESAPAKGITARGKARANGRARAPRAAVARAAASSRGHGARAAGRAGHH